MNLTDSCRLSNKFLILFNGGEILFATCSNSLTSMKMIKPKRECDFCGMTYTPKRRAQKFCSETCGHKNRRTYFLQKCRRCGAALRREQQRAHNEYCSLSCANSIITERRIQAAKKMAEMPDHQPNQFHFLAKKWWFTSPMNKDYNCINLKDFIRRNSNLFNPDDVHWVVRQGNLTCRAYCGLRSLRPSGKCVLGSWKGWRWNSITDRRFGSDPVRVQST